MFIYTHGV